MRIGRHQVSFHNHGFFRLDGGAMFGSVPKNIWENLAPTDEQNRIVLATRSLVIESGDRKILVDVGCGDKWSAKARAIYAIPEGRYEPVPGVTDVLLTHLHFDHGGGVSRHRRGSDEVEPCYPTARHWVGAANFENAKSPNVRERASYLKEDLLALAQVDLRLTENEEEIFPGLRVHRSDGHTRGLQWIELSDEGTTIAYPADLIPTAAHLPVPFVMGYDICAETSMREKGEFLLRAVEERWIVAFEHDPETAAARLKWDERGRAEVSETIA